MTLPSQPTDRRLPVGAEIVEGRIHLRVWAPDANEVVVLHGEEERTTLTREDDGHHQGWFAGRAGTLYRLLLDGEGPFPDPASRFQPDGPHGPSMVVDPTAFAWSDGGWTGVAPEQAIVYELHLGTFSASGDWAGAAARLGELAELGINVVEVMPVADFPGRFGWGYDGVNFFAPTRLYGGPDDMRRFVDRAHGLGIAVILDVVYNHVGPDGNYLPRFAASWFTDAHECEWGDAINFDGPGSEGVREYYVANAAYWIDEYHLDGLRLDATQQIFDSSDDHVLAGIARAVRRAGGSRNTLLVTENEPQDPRMVRPPEGGGLGLDLIWNDDFHHSALVAVSGHNEAYFSDHLGRPQELLSCAKWGFLYQGQHYGWQKQRRGAAALDLPPFALVNFLQNHDQVANTPLCLRGHQLTSPGRWRAITALLLLMPGTPMLFQGQEYSAPQPFLYFADHEPELAALVARGRREFMRQFPSLAQVELTDPHDPSAFRRCRLDPEDRRRPEGEQAWRLHRDLIALRRGDPVLGAPRRATIDGSVLAAEAFLLRWFAPDGEDRLLLVNLGRDLELEPAPDPLLAPPAGKAWRLHWSSEEMDYGGRGTVPPEDEEGRWRLAGHAAILLKGDGTPAPSRS